MKKVAKILGAILLSLLSVFCLCIIIGSTAWYIENPGMYTITPMAVISDGIIISVGILSGVGAKKLIFPKKTTELDLDEEAAAEAKKKRIKRTKILALVMSEIVGIIVIAVLVRPCLIGNHNYDGGVVVSEPTCSVAGERVFTCTVCKKDSYTERIPLDRSAHNWGEFEVVTEGSGCDIPGEQVKTCKACGEQESEEIKPPLEHEYGEWEFEGRNKTKFKYISTCTKCGAEGFKYEDRHKVKCKLCNGTGSVKYNYGSSDLEAILSGHDPYTFGPCSSCDGTGKAYADYPWE